MAKTMESLRERLGAAGWQYYVILGLGVWLFISPWILQFGISPYPTGPEAGAGGSVVYFNPQTVAQVFGIILVALAATALYDLPFAQEWSISAFGLWIIFAPWILGFFGPGADYAKGDFVVVGLLTCLAMLSWFYETGYMTQRGGRFASRRGAIMPMQSPAHAGDKPSIRRPDPENQPQNTGANTGVSNPGDPLRHE